MPDENDIDRRANREPAGGWKRNPQSRWRKGDHAAPPREKPGFEKKRAAKSEPSKRDAPERSAFGGERIAKVIARAGLCSRREAEEWIEQGRVAVNGRVLPNPAFNVVESDKVTVDGKPLAQRERTRAWLFHKPRGYLTTDSDPEGRPLIFDVLPPELPRVVTIGRLDFNTEGLLLLTNDGGLARALELPATGWLRRYRVRANGSIDQGALDLLADGITVEGVSYAGIEAKIDRVQGANVWLSLGLREGKNREVKRVLEHLGLAVSRLIRVSFGPFQLGELEAGGVSEIKTRTLRDQLGEALARQASADFDAPVRQDRPQSAAEERPRERRERESTQPARVAETRHGEPPRRKYVATLREERAESSVSGPRKRLERSSTEDRRGRSVAVERLTSPHKDRLARTGKSPRFAKPQEERRAFGDESGPRARKPHDAASDQRRSAKPRPERRDDRPMTGRRDDRKREPFKARAERGEVDGNRVNRFTKSPGRPAPGRPASGGTDDERARKPRFDARPERPRPQSDNFKKGPRGPKGPRPALDDSQGPRRPPSKHSTKPHGGPQGKPFAPRGRAGRSGPPNNRNRKPRDA